jgi:hypothetical protein
MVLVRAAVVPNLYLGSFTSNTCVALSVNCMVTARWGAAVTTLICKQGPIT